MLLESAVRRQLLHDRKVSELAGDRVFKYRPRPGVVIDGSGRLSLVVNRQPGWGTPDPVNTQRFPVVRVEVTADPSRTPEGEIAVLDADDRAAGWQLILDRMFHGKRGWWCGPVGKDPGLFVISSQRWSEPTRVVPPDSFPKPRGDTVSFYYDYAFTI